MYNFIFWFFYKYFEWKNKDDSKFIPATLVIFTIVIHLFLLYSIYRFWTHTNALEWGTGLSYGQRKFLIFPFLILNILLIVLIMVVPLIIAIRLTNMSI